MVSTRYLPFAGRLMIGLPFAMSGLGKLAAYGATTAYIGAVGWPLPPLAYAVAVTVELILLSALVLNLRSVLL